MNKESVNNVVAKLTQLRNSMNSEERAILDGLVCRVQEDEVVAHALKDAVQGRNIALSIDDATQTYKLAN